MKHTPGPWHVGVRQAEKIVYDATGWAIANATVYHGESDAEQVKANARLIAAAPDLLAALKRIVAVPAVDYGYDAGERLDAIMDIANKAIRKAEMNDENK